MQRYKVISYGRVLQGSGYVFFAVVFDREKGVYFREEVQNCSDFNEFLQVLKKKLYIGAEAERR